MKIPKQAIFKLWLVLAIFPIFSIDKVDFLGFEAQSEFAYSKILRLIWLLLVILVGTISCIHERKILRKGCMNKYSMLLLLNIFFVLVSIIINTPTNVIAWYRSFELVVIQISLLILVTLFKHRIDLHAICLLIAKSIIATFWILLIVVFALGIVDIRYILMSEIQGRLRLGGYAYSPNALSIFLTTVLVSMYYCLSLKKYNVFYGCAIVILIHYMVLLTDSRTGIAVMTAIDVLFLWKNIICVKFSSLIRKQLLAVLMTMLLILIFMVSDPYAIIEKLGSGDDPLQDLLTLNNRASIYLTAFAGIYARPMFGYGYVEGVKKFLAENYSLSYWLPPHTHNILLEIVLSLGVIGAIPLLLYVMLSVVKVLKYLFTDNTSAHTLYLSTVIFSILISSVTMVPIGNIVLNNGTIYYLCTYVFLSFEMHNSCGPNNYEKVL
ncbi:O-antigen ligase family protein [Geobacter benzoatilyticus]|uniref:O-antigen ligase family protein n=1 Tax=Geobacter benzoatilyticus TaxID=2815309 RepID=A0ABX7Q150_9BACT|nr:O-antigen ligase family protein [Geobacter benzoatilyticus]QSV44855.1 O-antigen ligase family protein [Geobacter benzoatilyticus]